MVQIRAACQIAVLLAACFLPSVGLAEPGAWEIGVQPGYAIFTDIAGDYFRNAASISGSALYGAHDGLSVGLELGYVIGAKLDGMIPGTIVGDLDNDAIADSIPFSSDIKAGILHITPVIKLGPTFEQPGHQIRPYVIAGGGLYRTSYSGGDLLVNGVTSRGLPFSGIVSFDEDTESNGGFNIGGGIDWYIGEHLLVAAEGRYHQIIYDEIDDLTFLMPSLRISWIF